MLTSTASYSAKAYIYSDNRKVSSIAYRSRNQHKQKKNILEVEDTQTEHL